MLVRVLIDRLLQLIIENQPHEAILGEATIEIDTFRWNEAKQAFDYLGFDHDVRITKSADGVYDILTAIEEVK